MFMNQIQTEETTIISDYCLFHSVDLEDLVNEIASLKEQNGLMEMELKEMQERYSEISVRFAEVEGGRERLVMTVRNAKNAKRS